MSEQTATIADVARMAGVSRAAVSKVLRNAYGVSEEMRTKVQFAIDELGYRPRVAARAMRGASYALGIEVPTTANPFFDKLIRGAMSELEDTPYQVIIAPTGVKRDDGKNAIQTLADWQVSGIVAISPTVPAAWLDVLARRTPVVVIGLHHDSPHYDTIVTDDLLGSRLVVEHLYGLGHRDIVHLTLAPNSGCEPRSPHAVRAEGFRRTLERLGYRGKARIEYVESSESAAYHRTLELLDSGRAPTAIFAGHDELAVGVLRAIAERGLTPADIAVAGYDGAEIASHPLISLTTIDQSPAAMGARGARLLMERIAGRTEPVRDVFIPELRPRSSSVTPRNTA